MAEQGIAWLAEREAENGWRLADDVGVVVERRLVAASGWQKVEVNGREPQTAEEGKAEQGSWEILDGFVAAAATPGGWRRCLLAGGTSG